MNQSATTRTDLYEAITARVLEGLKTKGLQWFRPWGDATTGFRPMNWSTKTYYRGINVMLLGSEMFDKGYTHNEWLTYKQASEAKGQVRKGEKSTIIVYWVVSFLHTPTGKWYNETDLKKAGIPRSECDERWSLRSFNVFNIAQVDSLEPRNVIATPERNDEPVDADWVLANYMSNGPALRIGGDSASYRPSSDTIQMPAKESFVSQAAYYHTLFHEATHSTGHASRLKREGVTKVDKFGSEQYAQEELVAEIGAEYLSAVAGIENDQQQSQAYINGWVSYLTDHPKVVVYAAQQAAAACEFILK